MGTLTRTPGTERSTAPPTRPRDTPALYRLGCVVGVLVLFLVGLRAFAATAMDSDPHGSVVVPFAVSVAALTAPQLGMWLSTRERAWGVRTAVVLAVFGTLAVLASNVVR